MTYVMVDIEADGPIPGKTEHTHHPVDDVKGNAEALLHMQSVMGLKIKL